MEEIQQSTEMSSADMDQAINGTPNSNEIPMERQAPVQAPVEEYTLNINGKEIKAPRDKVLQWAQMGYNYPQKAAELNKQQQEFEKQRLEQESKFKDYETKYNPYKQVDEYAAQNPEWWQQVQKSWQEKQAQASGAPPEINALKEEILNELKPVKEFMRTSMSEKEAHQIEVEDKQLTSEIESIRKTYANIDFDTPDAEGKSLEMKVLEHAMANNIASFRVAFRDLEHERLVGLERDKGKEAVSKEIQKRSKLGILGESSKPTRGLKMAENVKNKSYDQLMQEGLAEEGLA